MTEPRDMPYEPGSGAAEEHAARSAAEDGSAGRDASDDRPGRMAADPLPAANQRQSEPFPADPAQAVPPAMTLPSADPQAPQRLRPAVDPTVGSSAGASTGADDGALSAESTGAAWGTSVASTDTMPGTSEEVAPAVGVAGETLAEQDDDLGAVPARNTREGARPAAPSGEVAPS